MANIFYINNKGQRVDFDGLSYIFGDIGSMLKYEWSYTSNDYKNVIDSFSVSMVQKDFSIGIKGRTKEEYHSLIQYIENVIDSDLVNRTQGKLYFGEWYLPCYVIGCTDETYDATKRMGTRKYTILSEDGQWIRATRYRNEYAKDRLKYPYDFTVDRIQVLDSSVVASNGTPRGADFLMLIEKPNYSQTFDYCEIQKISDNNSEYKSGLTKYECGNDEYIEINSYDKTIYYCDTDGNRENYFMNRDKDLDDIFEKLESGVNVITPSVFTSGQQTLSTFAGVELVVYEKKSNPEWWS